MRSKIIGLYAAIVLMVGVLSYVVVKYSLGSALGDTSQLLAGAQREAAGAAARLELDGLRGQRWLLERAMEASSADALSGATAAARENGARKLSDAVLAAAKQTRVFPASVPAFTMVVDAEGKVVGRSGSELSRGDDLGAIFPGLKKALATGAPASELWTSTTRTEQALAVYAPVRDAQGKVLGLLVLAGALNDTLSRLSEQTTGRGLLLAVQEGDAFRIVARSTNTAAPFEQEIARRGKAFLGPIASTGAASSLSLGDTIAAAAPVEGRGIVLVAALPSALVDNVNGLATPILWLTGFGLVLVIFGGFYLANYIIRPITVLEEGLLGILNGETERRFELDHDELGGLAFRIDQLLNQFMGVDEDNTDAEGRSSGLPRPANFQDAMSVDEAPPQADDLATVDEQTANSLRDEAEDAYYKRLFDEYAAAKTALGEAVSAVTLAAFQERVRSMEATAKDKHGRRVRYQVRATGNEVVLVAVALT